MTEQAYNGDAPNIFKSSVTTMIVFCHLRWDFVYQRPQQLLSRLAEHYRILVVEEPIFHEGEPFLKSYSPTPNVTVYQPHSPVHAHGFHDDQIALLQPLLAELVPSGESPIAWFYTPMALPLLQTVHPSLIVYDCMDELSAFKNAPKQLLQRESALLNIADVVFTGGPSLYQAKRERHANAHCFSSSVDLQHFSKALDRTLAHPSQASLRHPRLGFYGVIDERFDVDLLRAIADARPDWELVMVGPIVKIDQAALPRNPNIHYMGQANYDELPQYLAAWDVCLMPFALNDSTKFISPTKVLEYMAAELPIVSTNITDVAKPYSSIVSIAHSPEDFIRACDEALALTPERRAKMADDMRAVVKATSWDATANGMRSLMNAGATGKKPGVMTESGSSARINSLPSNNVQDYKCVIIGGGPTGLSAAYHLDKDTLLLDKNPTAGGWCRSIEDGGFTFDYAGHIMFSNDPYVLKLYDKLLGDNLHWQNREAWVYSKSVYTRYPFQGALYGLPPKVITECIVGAIEARYGAPKEEVAPAKAACELAKPVEDCCADGGAEVPTGAGASASGAVAATPAQPANFEEFIYKVWGAGIAKHFAIPYNKKIWTVPLTEMETSWLGGRVPLPDLGEIIEGALEPVGKPMGPNARFGYPLKGGFQALVQGFLPFIEGKVENDANVIQVVPSEHTVALADGRRFRYDHLISTMPLPELVKVIGDEAPEEVRMAAKGLNHISIRNVNLGIKRANLTEKHWIYYPEDTIFHRIFVQGNASPHCNAPGGFGLTCEISYSPWKPLPVDGKELIARCIDDCIKVGIFNADDEVIVANEADMPYAYVVYDHARAKNVATVKQWLAQ
ncbi:MAG: NAD(P)-binding protein, partial [Bdellovibrionales bacterium]|nr:NAD(P)-binding protein [Massilia sp.]